MKATVTMDEVGRLVLPKSIREAIGIFGRTLVSIEVTGKSARIMGTQPAHGAVARKRGRLVYTGPLPENWDSGQAVLAVRQRRVRR